MKNLKDKLVEDTARELEISESLVESVISFQFKDAVEAMKSNREVEFSGWGKFILSPNKIKRKIAKYKLNVEFFLQTNPSKAKSIQEELENLKKYEQITGIYQSDTQGD